MAFIRPSAPCLRHQCDASKARLPFSLLPPLLLLPLSLPSLPPCLHPFLSFPSFPPFLSLRPFVFPSLPLLSPLPALLRFATAAASCASPSDDGGLQDATEAAFRTPRTPRRQPSGRPGRPGRRTSGRPPLPPWRPEVLRCGGGGRTGWRTGEDVGMRRRRADWRGRGDAAAKGGLERTWGCGGGGFWGLERINPVSIISYWVSLLRFSNNLVLDRPPGTNCVREPRYHCTSFRKQWVELCGAANCLESTGLHLCQEKKRDGGKERKRRKEEEEKKGGGKGEERKRKGKEGKERRKKKGRKKTEKRGREKKGRERRRQKEKKG